MRNFLKITVVPKILTSKEPLIVLKTWMKTKETTNFQAFDMEKRRPDIHYTQCTQGVNFR